MRSLSRAYGAHPLHLLALLGCFALTGYVVVHVVNAPLLPRMVIWFVAAVVAHDLILFPLYALADRSLHGLLSLVPSRPHKGVPVVPPLNYVRIPALGAGLTFVLFLPGIIQQGGPTYAAATGQTQAPYLGRWLLLAAAMFLASAIVYAIRTRIAGAPARAAAREVASILTEPHERVVTVASRDGAPVLVLSSHALYHRTAQDWQRLDWADVADVRWSTTDSALHVSGARSELMPLDDPADLVEVAHGLIAPTLLLSTTTEIGTISVRRHPHSDDLVWRVRLGQDIDPADPRIDATIHAMSADLGLNSSRDSA
ncbi:MAG TPA: hypothetical protein VGN81_09375 [Pseudonocardiaceae bacterium]|jgi:hypothetical protein